jgi:hypothetical protein
MKTLIATLILIVSLWLISPVHAALDFDGTDDNLRLGSVLLSAAPMTVCAWVNLDNNTSAHTIFHIGDTAAAADRFQLDFNGAGGGSNDPVRFVTTRSTSGTASTANFYTASTWHHGCGRTSGAASRYSALDGTMSGEETSNLTPANLDDTNIGVRNELTDTLFTDGRIAELGVWNRALSDGEILSLSKGFSPKCFPSGLVSYIPMINSAQDHKGNAWTVTGTAAAVHTRIFYCH